MRKVFETISDVVLPAVVFLAVLAILLGSSLLGRVGARMEEPGEDFSQMGDSYAVQAFSERNQPERSCGMSGKSFPSPRHFLELTQRGIPWKLRFWTSQTRMGSVLSAVSLKKAGRQYLPAGGFTHFCWQQWMVNGREV